MGSKGSTRHQKRLNAPITYPIARKQGVFTIRPNPTRYRMEDSLPLGIVLREILGYAKTLAEAKKILSQQVIKVDGHPRANHKFAIGPFDILEITKTNEIYRLTPYRGKRRFILHPIPETARHLKILRVQGKKTIRGGHIELTFHDGRTHIVPQVEKEEAAELVDVKNVSPKDSIMFNLETKTMEDHIPFAEGNMAVIMGGHSVGVVGTISTIETLIGKRARDITLKTADGEIKTTDQHIFMIGRNTPLVEIPQPETGDPEDE